METLAPTLFRQYICKLKVILKFLKIYHVIYKSTIFWPPQSKTPSSHAYDYIDVHIRAHYLASYSSLESMYLSSIILLFTVYNFTKVQ